MNKISFSDLNITCVDRDQTFIFSAGEQAFFASKALSPPKRCLSCRKQRKLTIVPDINSLPNWTSCQPITADLSNGGTK